jgi:hypothetical protein
VRAASVRASARAWQRLSSRAQDFCWQTERRSRGGDGARYHAGWRRTPRSDDANGHTLVTLDYLDGTT